MKRYALGLDFGTNSCRAVLVELSKGRETSSAVFPYPTGEAGIVLDRRDANVARQHPSDYLKGLTAMVRGALRRAAKADHDFSADRVIAVGVDTTGSTPIPVDRQGTPLALTKRFARNPHAMAWLWKDHTAHAEAAEITDLARRLRPQYLAKCGGTYSSEWFWSKILRCRRVAPDVFAAAHSFVEHCDYVPALLSGNTAPEGIARSVCAAGHKAMYSPDWGGLPDAEFLAALDPALSELRGRLYDVAVPADRSAGTLCAGWAKQLGLCAGIPIAVGAFDAHMGAVGAGIREGTLVKILGTSTCDMMVRPADSALADIPGVCGIVRGSILPDFYGIEAGQSAVGDIFLWFVNHLVPDRYGRSQDARFAALGKAAARLRPGEHGLLCLDWNNGNRTVLVDPLLTGLVMGQTLHTEAHEVYRALIEATAFGSLKIIRRIEEYGVAVRDVVTCGGLATKNSLLMQIYADVTGRPMRVAASEQTCAVGAALFGAVVAGRERGGFASVAEAQSALSRVRRDEWKPDPAAHAVYGRLFDLYGQIHDAFGTREWQGNLHRVMKELLQIRATAR